MMHVFECPCPSIEDFEEFSVNPYCDKTTDRKVLLAIVARGRD